MLVTNAALLGVTSKLTAFLGVRVGAPRWASIFVCRWLLDVNIRFRPASSLDGWSQDRLTT